MFCLLSFSFRTASALRKSFLVLKDPENKVEKVNTEQEWAHSILPAPRLLARGQTWV